MEESCIEIICRLYKVKHCQNILEFLLLISKFQVYQMKNLVEEAICYYFSELAQHNVSFHNQNNESTTCAHIHATYSNQTMLHIYIFLA